MIEGGDKDIFIMARGRKVQVSVLESRVCV